MTWSPLDVAMVDPERLGRSTHGFWFENRIAEMLPTSRELHRRCAVPVECYARCLLRGWIHARPRSDLGFVDIRTAVTNREMRALAVRGFWRSRARSHGVVPSSAFGRGCGR